ncbi:hypothetical protein BASA81_004418 [Batrachochytrium salamandrivorans]|nr:hypothetical protein BASA81_004418 [Batrachochytrium salamandrivorans]
MGCFVSSPKSGEDKKDKEISKLQNQAERKAEDQIKLLLLGAGESGKSTIFKQMKILYGEAWDAEELVTLRPVVYTNVIQNMRLVLDYISVNGLDFGSESIAEVANKARALPDDMELNKEIGKWMKTLWANQAVKEAWEKRSGFQVLDCLEYYCEQMDRISVGPSYIPTQQDILQARVRTTGIVEEKYLIDGIQFVMFDVGGQRNERKKWLHAFQDVTAMIFVAAISEYDQVLYEDSNTNRIDEATKLFDEVGNSQWFSKTSMILFLNKNDLFLEKLKHVPLRVPGVRNDDFQGPYAEEAGADFNKCVEAAHEYLTGLFTVRIRDGKRHVYTHITMATDSKQTYVVLNSCKDIILRGNLQSAGFME